LINCKLDLSTPNDDFYNDCNVSPLKDFRAAIGLKPTSSNKKKEKENKHLKPGCLYIYIHIYCYLYFFCLNQRSKQQPLLTCFSFSTLDRNKVPHEQNSDGFPKEDRAQEAFRGGYRGCRPRQRGEHPREKSAALETPGLGTLTREGTLSCLY